MSGGGASPSGSILLIEDDADIQESISELLSLEGYDVHRAGHGADALQLLKTGIEVKLILLDLMMPVMDGYQFREQIRREPGLGSIPIIVMSADGHLKEKMAAIGVRSYLKKPVDVDVLIRSVKAYF